MKIELKNYKEQIMDWPQSGYHIMAQYDDKKIIVYQSYKKEIGDFAVKNQFFGGGFSLERMTWIKPNFLWMMFRNGWGTKEGQESVLAIHLKREAFEKYLHNAIYSSYNQTNGITNEEWQEQVKTSNVRLQWDPDHDPFGAKVERKAIQIGLRNEFIKAFAKEDILLIEDISNFVTHQYENVKNNQLENLIIPLEKPLVFEDRGLNKKLKISNEYR
jgi:hypothetical protein